MSFGLWLLLGWVGLAVLAWLGMYLGALITIGGVRRLWHWQSEAALALERYPKLSVVVPARDEAKTIEPALRSLLASDYPDLEVIVVNDRSSDGTGDIARRVGADDARLRVLRVDTLPDGWLGKVNALEQGRQLASGEIYLFTDADIVFERADLLRRAVGTLEVDKLDQLTLGPEMIADGFWHRVLVNTFVLALMWQLDARKVEDPDDKAFIGVGAFNMVRRSAFEKTEGFAWLRLEIADDMGLGMMLKHSGARCRAGVAYPDLSVRWYETFGAMVRGLEKNTFPGMSHCKFWRAVLVMLAWALVLAGPPLGLICWLPGVALLGAGAPAWLSSVGAASASVIALQLCFSLVIARIHRRPTAAVALHPIGQWLLLYILSRSTWRYYRERGVSWRETRYELDDLRAQQRVKV